MAKPKPYFLIADDDPDDQFMLQDVITTLYSEEVGCHFVDNGVELIRFLDKMNHRPNLVILDLNMPQKDGREALRDIRSNPDLASVPIVILTTSQLEKDLEYCQIYGISGYYHKPNSISELREIFRKLHQQYFLQ
jgi:CheY-like chemotaxis protein